MESGVNKRTELLRRGIPYGFVLLMPTVVKKGQANPLKLMYDFYCNKNLFSFSKHQTVETIVFFAL
jgi:hypothetical protein